MNFVVFRTKRKPLHNLPSFQKLKPANFEVELCPYRVLGCNPYETVRKGEGVFERMKEREKETDNDARVRAWCVRVLYTFSPIRWAWA